MTPVTHRASSWRAAGVALALGVAISACGSAPASSSETPLATGTPSAASLATVIAAAQRTSGTSAQYTLTLTNASDIGGSGSAMGAIDLARAQGSLALTLGADQGVEQIIFTPANVYIHPPANQTRSGKPWEASSFADTGSFAQLLFQVESIDPGFTLAEVSAGAVMASTAGHVMVNGSETSRYVVTVDVNRAYKGVTGPGAAGYAEGLSTELNAKPTLTLVVDIDNLGRIVRIEVTPPGPGVGDIGMTLQAFGTPVSVTPPPASQTTDISPSSSSEGGSGEKPGQS